MAVLSVLAFIAVPKYFSYTAQAKMTKLVCDARLIEDGCHRYYIDNSEWPRLGDISYTAEEIQARADEVYDISHQTVVLEPDGAYYDLDLSKLTNYIRVESDYRNFVLQNPIGNVYILDPKTNIKLPGNEGLSNVAPTAVITMTPDSGITTSTAVTWSHENSTDPNDDDIVDTEWEGNYDSFPEAGEYTVRLRVKDEHNLWSEWTNRTFTVYDAPIAILSMSRETGITSDLPLTFTAGIESGTIVATEWEGDGGGVTPDPPGGCFPEGDHEVRLRVQNENGVWSEWESKEFHVYSLVTATINMDPSENISTLSNVVLTASINRGTFASAEWIKDEGETTTIPPDGAYAAGSHTVRMRACDTDGCWSDWTETVFDVIDMTGIEAITGGNQHTVILKRDGTIWASGYGYHGQLGQGNTNNSTTFIQTGTDNDWDQITAKNNQTLAIKKDGTLWAWGTNGGGQLGLGDTTTRYSPVQVGTAANWKQVATGNNHTLAIKKDGTLWAWGANNYYQLGMGDTDQRKTPVQVGTDTDWKMVTANNLFSLAIKENGTLWAWGYNTTGQLGLGDTTNRFQPTQVGTDTNWKQIMAGFSHSLAIKENGTLWAWGKNSSGQLGLSDTTQRTSPVQVGTSTDWHQLTAGDSHSLATKEDGTLWAWGENGSYQLGINTTADKNTLVQVNTDIDWKLVASGDNHSLAVKEDGSLWVWGINQYGQLGLEDQITRRIPTLTVFH